MMVFVPAVWRKDKSDSNYEEILKKNKLNEWQWAK